jgi:hypothetical protein
MLLPTSFVFLLILADLIIACVIGVLLGFVSSRLLRLPWNLGTATLDVVMAVVCAFTVLFGVKVILLWQSSSQPAEQWFFIGAAGGVVLRQLMRLAMRPSR